MKIEKEKLLKILAAAKPGLAKKEFIEQACHFIFTGNEIATFNDQICIIYPFKSDFKFSVQGEEFYKTIESINEEMLEIALDGETVLVNAKKTQAGLSTIVGEKEKVEDRIEFLKKTVSAKKFWKNLPKGFKEGVSLCMFSAMKDLTMKTKCCVAIKENLIVSLDKFRASKYILEEEMEGEPLFIPAKDCYDLVRYEIVKYGRSEGWAHFSTKDGVVFNCKTMEGEYPWKTIEEIFEPPEFGELEIPKEMQPILQAASVFASDTAEMSKLVEITIDKKKITCKSEKERGWMIKQLDIENKEGVTANLEINCVFFNQILNNSTRFYMIKDSKYPDKAAFKSKNFTHLIALRTERKEGVENVRRNKRK